MSVKSEDGEREAAGLAAASTGRPRLESSAQHFPPRACWGLFIALALGWFGSFALFPGVLFYFGVNHFGVWFLDTFALLASNDAVTRGLDPYAPNALDYLQRPHVYSHWWLHLRDLGLTRADTPWLGLMLVIAFLATALARLRPRTPGELLWYASVLFSFPVVLALERANNDLVVFLLLSLVVPGLLSGKGAVRFLAAVPIAIAAGLKFYPAVAAVVLANGTEKRDIRTGLMVAVVLLALVGVNVAPDVAWIGSFILKAEGLMTFGALNLLEAVGLMGWPATALGLGLGALAIFGFLRSRLFEGWKIAPENESAWLHFVLGASLLAGCFFTGANHAYRWIFAVWLAPLLWSLRRDSAAPVRVRRLAGLTTGLLVFVLWSDSLASAVLALCVGRVPAPELMRWANQFFVLEQPVVWAFFWCLLGFLTHFAREAGRALFARA